MREKKKIGNQHQFLETLSRKTVKRAFMPTNKLLIFEFEDGTKLSVQSDRVKPVEPFLGLDWGQLTLQGEFDSVQELFDVARAIAKFKDHPERDRAIELLSKAQKRIGKDMEESGVIELPKGWK